MRNLNIYTLLMCIRGFSNQITVRGLSSKLGISYATLARCKNGVWPRSITLDAMRNVLEECRVQLFDGSQDAMIASILLQLRNQEVSSEDLQALEEALARDGYSCFLDELLTRASLPR